MIDGNTILIAHIGYPTRTFKSPMIYNPYFHSIGVNAVVVPMGVRSEDYAEFLRMVFRLTNIRGALITMPHKVATVRLVDELSVAGQIAGACNAVVRREDGTLLGDMFDGEGFVRGLRRAGCSLAGASALVVGSGGVGSAIAASLAGAGVSKLGIFDINADARRALGERLRTRYPRLSVVLGNDPAGYDIVINATPLGMDDADPLPVDISRLAPSTYVGEVVMRHEMTPFLQAAAEKGCKIQIGTDMLFEQIPAYLEFFGFPTTTPETLRDVATLRY
ncbi:MAG: shikimate 5-dehydrogenase [Beijerinckiaceae bacterium]